MKHLKNADLNNPSFKASLQEAHHVLGALLQSSNISQFKEPAQISREKETSNSCWLSVSNASEHLGISQSYLNKLRSTGGGPRFSKAGSKVLYKKEELDNWLELKSMGSTSEEKRNG
uniref:Helix-turn-helix domain-containing protein n=1 Tax=Magnetococcus massalia (strain MO-1) TaxID=451514 RepID=A0A1S7LPI3_MAGMO|nr:Protein of unknown function [Candidatus Magnetococcus massalia]